MSTATDTTEIRHVDPTTGAEKGAKLARFDLIPVLPLVALAEHYGRGARKYADRNWERGYSWSFSFAALMRHAWAFWRGEEIDEETGSPHLAAVAWHALTLLEFTRTHPEKDDRPKESSVPSVAPGVCGVKDPLSPRRCTLPAGHYPTTNHHDDSHCAEFGGCPSCETADH